MIKGRRRLKKMWQEEKTLMRHWCLMTYCSRRFCSGKQRCVYVLFSLDVVIVSLCAQDQEGKESFTASPKSNKQALSAFSSWQVGKLLSQMCSSEELIL